MKKSRFNPSQIASILKEFDGGSQRMRLSVIME